MAVDKVGIIYNLNDALLEHLCVASGQRHAGVAAAARSLKAANRITSSLTNTLVKYDFTYNFVRHLTSQHAVAFLDDVVRALEATHQRTTVLNVSGSMVTAKEDDAVSVDTVYPSDIHDIYNASWHDIASHSDGIRSPDVQQSPRTSMAHDHIEQPNAILTPISEGPQFQKGQRSKRRRHLSAMCRELPCAVPVHSSPPVVHRHGSSSSRRGQRWVPKDVVSRNLFEATDGATWKCPCGFINSSSNQRCGGGGHLGCKRARFISAGNVDHTQHRSRSPHVPHSSIDDIIAEASHQVSAGLTRVHIDGTSGSTIRSTLLSRPDRFVVEDKTNARGGKAFNVRLVRCSPNIPSTQPPDGFVETGPIGAYPKAVNPFIGGRI